MACSGCVTSAETVLITQQSTEEFKKALAPGQDYKVVVTVSPQSTLSIGHRYRLALQTEYTSLEIYNIKRSRLIKFIDIQRQLDNRF